MTTPEPAWDPAAPAPAAADAVVGEPAGWDPDPRSAPVGPPPPGPGVQPPFAAPPSQRDRKRIWISVGVAAAALVLCGGGGIVGCFGLVLWTNAEIDDQTRATTTRYLDAVHKGDYRKAYLEQCSDRRERETAEEYAARMERGHRLVSYTITAVGKDQQDATGYADVTLKFDDGSEDTGRLTAAVSQTDKKYHVCGGSF